MVYIPYGKIPYRERDPVVDLEARIEELEKKVKTVAKEKKRAEWKKRLSVTTPYLIGASVVLFFIGLIGSWIYSERSHYAMVIDPEGKTGATIYCGNDSNDCRIMAGKACPHGYNIVVDRHNSMLISCKPPVHPGEQK